MPEKQPTVEVHFRIPSELHDRLKAIQEADYHYATLAHLITTVLWDFVNSKESNP